MQTLAIEIVAVMVKHIAYSVSKHYVQGLSDADRDEVLENFKISVMPELQREFGLVLNTEQLADLVILTIEDLLG